MKRERQESSTNNAKKKWGRFANPVTHPREGACEAVVTSGTASKRPRTEEEEAPARRLVAFPYAPKRAEGGIRGDPFVQDLLLRKAHADMRFWTAEVLNEMDKRQAMAHLNRQIMEYNKIADFGMARAGWPGVVRRVIPFDMNPDARVVLLVTGPTMDEQKHGGGYAGMVWDRDKGEEVWKEFYNAQLVTDFKKGVAERAAGMDLSGVPFDRAFVVPLRKFDVENVDDVRIGNGSLVFARYVRVALCIVRPRIVVCMGREPARAILADLDKGEPTAEVPKERYNQVLTSKVVEVGSRDGNDVLGTLTYVETIHPFTAEKSDEEVSIVGKDSEGRDVEDHMHRAQIDAALGAKRAVLQKTHKIVGDRIRGQRSEVNPFTVLMNKENRIQFHVPGAQLAGKAGRKLPASAFAFVSDKQQRQQASGAGTGGVAHE